MTGKFWGLQKTAMRIQRLCSISPFFVDLLYKLGKVSLYFGHSLLFIFCTIGKELALLILHLVMSLLPFLKATAMQWTKEVSKTKYGLIILRRRKATILLYCQQKSTPLIWYITLIHTHALTALLIFNKYLLFRNVFCFSPSSPICSWSLTLTVIFQDAYNWFVQQTKDYNVPTSRSHEALGRERHITLFSLSGWCATAGWSRRRYS